MEHPGEPNRPPASAFLFIDSTDRLQNSSLGGIDTPGFDQPLNNFIIQKRQPFLTGYFTRLAVTELRFEYNTPNVNIRNNKFQVRIIRGAGPVYDLYTITIDQKFYTPEELATAVEAELQSVINEGTWECLYDPQQSAFTIANPDLTPTPPSTTAPGFTIEPYDYQNVPQTMRGLFYMMNFTEFNINQANALVLQTGAPFPSMCYTRYIDICSRQLTQYQRVKDNSTRENQTPAVLCRVYLGNYNYEGVGNGDASASSQWPGCAPCVIQRIYNVPKYSSWNPGAFIDQIDIQLRDDAGNLLYIPFTSDEDVNVPANEQELFGPVYNANQFQLTLHASET
jgi:hypothetical protein